MARAMERNAAKPPSVAMNGAMRPKTMSDPLMQPAASPPSTVTPPPIRTALSSEYSAPISAFIVVVPSAAARTTMLPTERSMPPETITSVMPTARIPTAELELSMARKFSAFRKSKPCFQKLAAKSSTNATTTPHFSRNLCTE